MKEGVFMSRIRIHSQEQVSVMPMVLSRVVRVEQSLPVARSIVARAAEIYVIYENLLSRSQDRGGERTLYCHHG